MVIKAYKERRPDYQNVAENAEAYDWKSENISYEDFLKLAEESDKRYEYIDGEVYLLASPSYSHQNIVWNYQISCITGSKEKNAVR